MDRIENILENRPDLVGQARRHRGRQVQQRVMHSGPVVQIAPQPQRILQHLGQTRTIASTLGQAGLLASYRSVEPFQVRGIYPLANAQFADATFDYRKIITEKIPSQLSTATTSSVKSFLGDWAKSS